MTVIVNTYIKISQLVPEEFEAQVKRNFERDPFLDGGDERIKSHIKKLMPVVRDEEIEVDFEMIAFETD